MKLRWLLMIVLYATCTLCFSNNPPDHAKEAVFQAQKAIPLQGYVPVSGGKLYYQSWGKGSPIIVIHGGPGLDQSYFLPQMLALSQGNQLVFYDQRGTGQSFFTNLDSNSINTKQFVQDIEAIRQALGFKKIILLGHSWGGLLAMHYAIAYPQYTKALIIMNGAPATSEGFKAFGNEFDKRTRSLQDDLAKIKNSPAFVQGNTTVFNDFFKMLFRKYLYNESDIQKLSVHFSAETAKNEEKIGSIFSQDFSKYDIRPELHHLNLPTLILHGETDPVPLWTARQTAESIPNAHLVVIKKSGHFSFVEQPEPVFSAIDQFLSRVESIKGVKQ